VLRGVHFGESPGTCYTVAKDGAVFAWEFESDKQGSQAATVFSPAYGKWKLKSKHVSTHCAQLCYVTHVFSSMALRLLLENNSSCSSRTAAALSRMEAALPYST
jgi:hypothetical protein